MNIKNYSNPDREIDEHRIEFFKDLFSLLTKHKAKFSTDGDDRIIFVTFIGEEFVVYKVKASINYKGDHFLSVEKTETSVAHLTESKK